MTENKKPAELTTDINSNDTYGGIIPQNTVVDKVIDIMENLNHNCARTGFNWNMKSYTWSDFVNKLSRVIKTNETIEQYQGWKKLGRSYTKQDMKRYGELKKEIMQAEKAGELFVDDEFKKLAEKRIIANKFKYKCSNAKDKGGFIGSIFSAKRRLESLMTHKTMLTIDIDGYKGSNLIEKLDKIVSGLGINAFIYSTHSHNPIAESYNLRLVIPFNKPITLDEYKWYSRKFTNDYLLENGKSMVDPASFKPNQLMFYPSCPSNVEAFTKEYKGIFLDVEESIIMDDITKWNDFEWDESEKKEIVKSNVKYDNSNKKSNSKKTHPHLLNGLAGDFCRVVHDIGGCINTYFVGEFEVNGVRATNNSVISPNSMQISEDFQLVYDHDTSSKYSCIMMNAFDMIKYYKNEGDVALALNYIEYDGYFNAEMFKACEALEVEKEIATDDYIYNLVKRFGTITRAFTNNEKLYFKIIDDSIIEPQPDFYIRVSKTIRGNYTIAHVFYNGDNKSTLRTDVKKLLGRITVDKMKNFSVLNEIIEKGKDIPKGNKFNVDNKEIHHDILVKNTLVIAGTGAGKTHEVAKFIVRNLGNPELIIASTKNNTNVDDLEKEIKNVINLYIEDKSDELYEWLQTKDLKDIGIYTLTRQGNLGISQNNEDAAKKIDSINAIITNNAYFGFVGDRAEYNDNMKAILTSTREIIMIYDEYESLVKNNLMKTLELNSYTGQTININGELRKTKAENPLSKYTSDAALKKLNEFVRIEEELKCAEINYLIDSKMVEGVFTYYQSVDKGENLKSTFDSMVKLDQKIITEYLLSEHIPVTPIKDDSLFQGWLFNIGTQVKSYTVKKDDIADENKPNNFRMLMNKQEGIKVETCVLEFIKDDELVVIENVIDLEKFLTKSNIDVNEFRTLVTGLGYNKYVGQLFVDFLQMKIPSIVDHYPERIVESYYISANKVEVEIPIDETLKYNTDANIKELGIFAIQSDNPDNVILDLIKETNSWLTETLVVFGHKANSSKIAKMHLPHCQYRGNMSKDGLNKNTQCTKDDNIDKTDQNTVLVYANGTECQGRNFSNSELEIAPLNFGVNHKGRAYWNPITKTIEFYTKIEMIQNQLRQIIGRILRTNRNDPVNYKAILLVGDLGIHNPKGFESKSYNPEWTVLENTVDDYSKFGWIVDFKKENIYNKSYSTKKGKISRAEIMNYLKAVIENKNHAENHNLDLLHFNLDRRIENKSIKKVEVKEIKKFYEKFLKDFNKKNPTKTMKFTHIEKDIKSRFGITKQTFYNYKKVW